MQWETLSSDEFKNIDRATPVFMNVAAIEQHGPHLPVDVDACIGRHFLGYLDSAAGARVLIMPQIKVCCSAHHIDYPGTLSVSHENLLAYAYDILSSVARHGFRNIVVFNSHGGNQSIGRVLVEKFGAAHPDCNAAFATWWTLAASALVKIRESPVFGLGHGCEFETSLMLLAAPDSVRTDLIPGQTFVPSFDWANGEMLAPSRAYLYRPIRDTSGGSGVLGNPSLATVEKGRQITDAVVAALLHMVDTFEEDASR